MNQTMKIREGDFDYVIVGGGTAGCVMAARLSEDTGVRVLLLEAGPRPNSLWVGMPSGLAKLNSRGPLNWGYTSQPEPTMKGRSIYVPRGRGLGGSSMINGMAYVRGHAEDYDGWDALGNKGWSWREVRPYFLKSENRNGELNDHHVRGGPWTVSDPQVKHPAVVDFIQAGVNAGIPHNPDYNAEKQEGIGYLQFSIRDGRRHTTADAFLSQAKGRGNLAIDTGAHVQRVVIENGRAVGVEYYMGDVPMQVRARKEVIVCAGAIDSPKILMLSGVGPAAHLQSLGIAVHADLPGVGQNLQDHLYAHMTCDSTLESSMNRDLRGLRAMANGAYYLLTRRGLLTAGASQACAWVRVMPDAVRPDVQIFFRPLSWEFSGRGRGIGRTPRVGSACSPLRPHSRGVVLLGSADSRQQVLIHPNYLTAERDQQEVVGGLKMMRRIFGASPLKARILGEVAPSVQCQTDAELLDYVRETATSQHHWAGTCKMGIDDLAVVDPELRVHGIDGLRVVDASIMPTIASGNTAAPTVMIAEKCADMIKAGKTRPVHVERVAPRREAAAVVAETA